MSTATVTRVRATERTLADWLASVAWAGVIGAASGSACVAIRLFFRLLQWVFVQQTGMLPIAAATLSPARRIVTPIIGAALGDPCALDQARRSTADLRFEEYVEAIRFRSGRIPLRCDALADGFLCFFRRHRSRDRTRRIDDPIRRRNLLMGGRAISRSLSLRLCRCHAR